MHTYSEIIPELDIPFVEMDIPHLELEIEDLPSLDEVLESSPGFLPPTPSSINQTPYTQRICIRINRAILDIVKKQAASKGMKYQTYINMLLIQQVASKSGL